MAELKLQLMEGDFTIHRFKPSRVVPVEIFDSNFFHITKTDEELSIVCPSSLLLNSEQCDADWSCIKVLGPLDLSSTGILTGLSMILAKARISIFAISTYDTDYILIKSSKIHEATAVLQDAGYLLHQSDTSDSPR